MKTRKVAVIGLKGLPAFGGAATVGENIIEQLKEEFDFFVYSVSSHTCIMGHYNGYTQIVFNKFPIKRLNIFCYYIKSLFHCLFLENYYLIHLHHIDGAFILPVLRLKYRVICTSHAQTYKSEKWHPVIKYFFKINEFLMLCFANEITTVSLPLTRIYESKNKNNVHYIPNGVNLTQRIGTLTSGYDNYILFAAGRIIPLKGLHVLLKAVKIAGYKDLLLVIGDLDQVPDYKKSIVEQASQLNIIFHPIIKQKEVLLNYVQNAKLFIFPSYSENMSIMLLEAAFVKTPIICSDIPENRIIFNDEEILFFKTNNAEDLANKLLWAFTHSSDMKYKAEAAYKKLKASFSWAEISQEYASLYYNCLK